MIGWTVSPGLQGVELGNNLDCDWFDCVDRAAGGGAREQPDKANHHGAVARLSTHAGVLQLVAHSRLQGLAARGDQQLHPAAA